MLNGNRDGRRACAYQFALPPSEAHANVKCVDTQFLEKLLKVNWHKASIMRVYGQVFKQKKKQNNNNNNLETEV